MYAVSSTDDYLQLPRALSSWGLGAGTEGLGPFLPAGIEAYFQAALQSPGKGRILGYVRQGVWESPCCIIGHKGVISAGFFLKFIRDSCFGAALVDIIRMEAPGKRMIVLFGELVNVCEAGTGGDSVWRNAESTGMAQNHFKGAGRGWWSERRWGRGKERDGKAVKHYGVP